MDLSYDGGPFNGWALQPSLRTVQGTLEEALALIVRRPVRVTVAGRTDAGVHARGQVVHIDLSEAEWGGLPRGQEIDPAAALLRRLRGALSRILQDETGAIEVHDVGLAPDGFDARFSALWRRYSYRIADGPERWDPVLRRLTLWHKAALDEDAMNRGPRHSLGSRTFPRLLQAREGATTIRELQRFEFVRGSDGVWSPTSRRMHSATTWSVPWWDPHCAWGRAWKVPGWLHERLLAGASGMPSRVGCTPPVGP